MEEETDKNFIKKKIQETHLAYIEKKHTTEYGWTKNNFRTISDKLYDVVNWPLEFIRGSIDSFRESRGPRPVYYHRRFQRVPTIDQCYEDDQVCRFEAEAQFERDWHVDMFILNILRNRVQDCETHEGPHGDMSNCQKLVDDYQGASTNYFIKYGELGIEWHKAARALMKQKHRMIWERRHGPVGSGIKSAYLSDPENTHQRVVYTDPETRAKGEEATANLSQE